MPWATHGHRTNSRISACPNATVVCVWQQTEPAPSTLARKIIPADGATRQKVRWWCWRTDHSGSNRKTPRILGIQWSLIPSMPEIILEYQEVIALVNLDQCRPTPRINQSPSKVRGSLKKGRPKKCLIPASHWLFSIFVLSILSVLLWITLFRGQNYANST